MARTTANFLSHGVRGTSFVGGTEYLLHAEGQLCQHFVEVSQSTWWTNQEQNIWGKVVLVSDKVKTNGWYLLCGSFPEW